MTRGYGPLHKQLWRLPWGLLSMACLLLMSLCAVMMRGWRDGKVFARCLIEAFKAFDGYLDDQWAKRQIEKHQGEQ